MKRVRVGEVVVSASALELAVSVAARAEVLNLTVELARIGVAVAAWDLSPRRAGWWDDAGSISGARNLESPNENTVAIGVARTDLPLREMADIYLHLGKKRDLYPRVGVSVPLFDQGVAGLLNGLRWALGAAGGIDLVQMKDLTDHARRSAASYESPSKPAAVEQVARAMASELLARFNHVDAILGTGFPFYCVDSAHTRKSQRYPVPESIRDFTATQADFFCSKLAPPSLTPDAEVSIRELHAYGSDPGQSEFNAYEYARWGSSPPSPPERGRLQDFFAANVLEAPDRLWPCDICTAVHDPSKFPGQAWIRDFMQSCVDCNQTAFLPRAIGVLDSDIDLIVVADVSRDDRNELATKIAEWIDEHPSAYRHDTDWPHQLRSETGPLDVFTVTRGDLNDALQSLAGGLGWEAVTVPCDVAWLPITHISYEIGKYFPLCVELLESREEAFRGELLATRASFARQVGASDVLDVFSSDSPYLRQLASNETIQEMLKSRNRQWRAAGSSV